MLRIGPELESPWLGLYRLGNNLSSLLLRRCLRFLHIEVAGTICRSELVRTLELYCTALIYGSEAYNTARSKRKEVFLEDLLGCASFFITESVSSQKTICRTLFT